MTLAGNILGKQDISFTKASFLATAHLNFSLSLKSDHVLPADNRVPGIPISCRALP